MQKNDEEIFQPALLTKRVTLGMILVDKFIQNTLSDILKKDLEGKCTVEGYIKSNSINIITYSSGNIKGSNIIFDVVFECLVCYPVEGMLLKVKAVSINTAGIKAESVYYATNEPSIASGGVVPTPYVLFISRNHHHDNDVFNSIQPNDTFIARVIVQRFELNDKYISIIGEIVSN
jgi:DNA-directed RNA polymerase subunit E'/Rpb7